MIRTEIDITNPQKVEVIATGKIGYLTFYGKKSVNDTCRVSKKNGEIIGWHKPEELRPLEDRLVFDGVVSKSFTTHRDDVLLSAILKGVVDKDNYDFKVIATPKEKSLEDMTKEELIEIVKQLKK